MKHFSLLFAFVCLSLAANAYTYEVALADAQWSFADTVGFKPALSTNENFVVPANCFSGTGGSRTPSAAYVPYVKPGKLSTTDTQNYGVNDGRYALYIGSPRNDGGSRLPAFFMLPHISDASYASLSLQFYARQENGTEQALKVGFFRNLSDTLRANAAAAIQPLDTLALTTAYTLQSVSLAGVPDSCYIVLYIDNTTAAAEYTYIDDIAFVSSTTPVTPQPEFFTITYNLAHCTGAADNPTAYTDADQEAEFEPVFTLEEGYDLDSVAVYYAGQRLDNLLDNYEADPYYYTEFEDGQLTVSIGYIEDFFAGNIVVYVAAKQPAVVPVPGMATFEEYLAVLPAEGGKYLPGTADATYYWQSGDYTFSCTRSWSGMMNDGFYAANWADTTYASYADDYKAITCGARAGSAYASLYYGGSWGGPCTVTCSARTVSGTYVTLALNPYRCIMGRSYCAAFRDGDYLYVHVSGKKEGAYTGTSADLYLADFRDGKAELLTYWQWMDLTVLGEVDELEFAIYDSQSGAGVGLYACFDNFGDPAGVAVDPTALPAATATSLPAQKIVFDNQIVILRDNHLYTPAGQRIR